MRYGPVVMLCLAAGLTTACGAAREGGGAAPAAPAPPVSLEERFVHQTIYELRDRYLSADVSGFMRLVSEGFYKGRSRLERSLEESLAAGRPARVDLVIAGVEMEDTRIAADLTWDAIFPAEAGGEGRSVAGKTLLIFHRGEALSLVDFRGDPLFGIELL